MASLRIMSWLWRILVTLLYCFLLSPLIIVLIVSFNANSYLSFPPTTLSIRWYTALLDNGEFISGFKVSVILAAATTAAAILIGVPAAFALARYRFRGRDVCVTFFTMPLMVPGVVLGLALLLVLAPLQLTASYPGLLAAHLLVTLPYVIRTVATSLLTLRPEYEEAGLSLGANPFRTFWTITLPLIRPGVVAGAVLAFLVSFDEVVITLFLVGPRLTTLPVQIFRYVEYRTDPQVAALSVVLVVISMTGIVVIERLLGLRRVL